MNTKQNKLDGKFFEVLREVVKQSQELDERFQAMGLLYRCSINCSKGIITLSVNNTVIWDTTKNTDLLDTGILLAEFKDKIRQIAKNLGLFSSRKGMLTPIQAEMIIWLLQVPSGIPNKGLRFIEDIDKQWKYIGLTEKQNDYLESLFEKHC